MTTTAVEVSGTNNGAQALTRAATEQRQAAAPAAVVMPPQYFAGFDGAAASPFSLEAAAVLAAPVNDLEVEIREDGIVYLPGVAYRRILTRAFGAGAWAILPRGPARTMGDLVVYHGALVVLGRFVSEAVGECQTRFGMSYASSLEGARTDCLTRCCKDLGVATELWDPAWRASWQAKYADKKWVDGKDGKKGRYSWSLKAKAAAGETLAGRNVGAPKAETGSSGSAPEAQPDKSSTQGTTSSGTVSASKPSTTGPSAGSTPRDTSPDDVPVVGDTGEAPSDDQIAALQKQAVALKWKGPKARAWLKKHFGVETATALTLRQAEDAMMLLIAAGKDDMDKEYGDLLALMEREGRVTV
jgi:hypothetical protein